MLDDILDNAASESLSHGLEASLSSSSRTGVKFAGAGAIGMTTSSSSPFLAASSSASTAAAAADRARLTRSTTLGFLLPQPKNHFGKLKGPHSRPDPSTSTVDPDVLYKLEEQNKHLPPQVSFVLCLSFAFRCIWLSPAAAVGEQL